MPFYQIDFHMKIENKQWNKTIYGNKICQNKITITEAQMVFQS